VHRRNYGAAFNLTEGLQSPAIFLNPGIRDWRISNPWIFGSRRDYKICRYVKRLREKLRFLLHQQCLFFPAPRSKHETLKAAVDVGLPATRICLLTQAQNSPEPYIINYEDKCEKTVQLTLTYALITILGTRYANYKAFVQRKPGWIKFIDPP